MPSWYPAPRNDARASQSTYLAFPTNMSSKPPKWDNFLLGDDVLQISHGSAECHALDGVRGFSGVLEVAPHVRTTSLA